MRENLTLLHDPIYLYQCVWRADFTEGTLVLKLVTFYILHRDGFHKIRKKQILDILLLELSNFHQLCSSLLALSFCFLISLFFLSLIAIPFPFRLPLETHSQKEEGKTLSRASPRYSDIYQLQGTLGKNNSLFLFACIQMKMLAWILQF